MKKNNPKYRELDKNTIKENKLLNKKKENKFIYVIIAFSIPILLYLQTINFKLTYFDDNTIISDNISFLSHFKNAHQAFLTNAFIGTPSSFYRPLQTLSYMIDIQLSGVNDIWMFHLSNILLLGLISCSLFLLLRRFLIPQKLALLSTLIYCVHPLFVSSIAWIPARGDLQLTLFSLLSFIFFIDFIRKRKIIYLFLNWIMFTIALFCKETAAFLPFIFIIYYFIFSSKKSFHKTYLLIILLYAISGIIWFWLRSKAIGGFSDPDGSVGLMPFLSNLPTIPESLTKFLFPIDNNPLPQFTILKTILGLGIIVLIPILFLKNKERSKSELLFGFTWFLILILPPMIFKPNYIDYLDHRFLLPLIGILLFILFILPKKWFEKGNVKSSWLMIFIIVILSSIAFLKSSSYTDPLTFYSSAISHNSNSALAYNNRGFIKRNKNDFQGAIDDLDKAIAISPDYAEAYNNRGNAKCDKNDLQGAMEDYNKAISLNPTLAKAYNNRGVVKVNMNNQIGAIEDYSKAITLLPNYAEAYNNKGVALGSSGNLQDAITNFDKAIEINPNYADPYINKAFAKYNLKDLAGTIANCEIALKLKPKSEKALNLITKAQEELNQKK